MRRYAARQVKELKKRDVELSWYVKDMFSNPEASIPKGFKSLLTEQEARKQAKEQNLVRKFLIKAGAE